MPLIPVPTRTRAEEGFTLPELLVVILIVGILTAIAVPSFLSQRTKADDACAKAMAKQMYVSMKTYETENGRFTGASIGALNQFEKSVTANQCGPSSALAVSDPLASPAGACPAGTEVSPASGATEFCVGAQSNSGAWYAISAKGGDIYRTCTPPTSGTLPAGGCRGSGTAGTW